MDNATHRINLYAVANSVYWIELSGAMKPVRAQLGGVYVGIITISVNQYIFFYPEHGVSGR